MFLTPFREEMIRLQSSFVQVLEVCFYSSRYFEFDRVFDPLVGLKAMQALYGYTHD
jgi:hypothetical protein